MKNTLALFDFDGTITTKDTLIEFIRFQKGSLKLYIGFIVLSPILVLYKLKLFPNWRAKEIMLAYFFKGIDQETFSNNGQKFKEEVLPKLLRKKALEEIERFKSQNARIVIVSASAEEWVKPWANSMELELLATKLEKQGGKVTGKISGKNCYGPEKTQRIKSHLDISDYNEIHAFGDSSGDKEMLELSTKPHYKPFR